MSRARYPATCLPIHAHPVLTGGWTQLRLARFGCRVLEAPAGTAAARRDTVDPLRELDEYLAELGRGPRWGWLPGRGPALRPWQGRVSFWWPGGGPRTLGGGRRPAPRPWPGRVSFWRLGAESFGTPRLRSATLRPRAWPRPARLPPRCVDPRLDPCKARRTLASVRGDAHGASGHSGLGGVLRDRTWLRSEATQAASRLPQPPSPRSTSSDGADANGHHPIHARLRTEHLRARTMPTKTRLRTEQSTSSDGAEHVFGRGPPRAHQVLRRCHHALLRSWHPWRRRPVPVARGLRHPHEAALSAIGFASVEEIWGIRGGYGRQPAASDGAPGKHANPIFGWRGFLRSQSDPASVGEVISVPTSVLNPKDVVGGIVSGGLCPGPGAVVHMLGMYDVKEIRASGPASGRHPAAHRIELRDVLAIRSLGGSILAAIPATPPRRSVQVPDRHGVRQHLSAAPGSRKSSCRPLRECSRIDRHDPEHAFGRCSARLQTGQSTSSDGAEHVFGRSGTGQS